MEQRHLSRATDSATRQLGRRIMCISQETLRVPSLLVCRQPLCILRLLLLLLLQARPAERFDWKIVVAAPRLPPFLRSLPSPLRGLIGVCRAVECVLPRSPPELVPAELGGPASAADSSA